MGPHGALVAMLMEQEAALPAVAQAVAALRLLRHLAHEEEELLPALGRLQVQV